MSLAPSTSTERTYRYLRLGVAGTVIVIFVAVALAASEVGWLTSISDYYYTPARDAFAGALIAASLALLALSGRGIERALLDAAALFAPLIALVPTTVGPGTIPGVHVPCADRCFPPDYEAATANGVLTYVIVGGVAVLLVLVLAALGQVTLSAVGASLIIAIGVIGAVALTWGFAREVFLANAHAVGTTLFFALFAAVALREAFPRVESPPTLIYRAIYTGVGVALVAVLIAYVVLLGATSFPVVLVIETAALALFLIFWATQGVQKWRDPDPTLV